MTERRPSPRPLDQERPLVLDAWKSREPPQLGTAVAFTTSARAGVIRAKRYRKKATGSEADASLTIRFPAPWRIVEIPCGFAVEDATGAATRRVLRSMTRHKGKLSAIDWPRVAGQRGFRYVGMMLSRKDAARGARQDRWRLRKRRSRVKGLSDETGLINLRRSPSTESGPAPPKHNAISPAR